MANKGSTTERTFPSSVWKSTDRWSIDGGEELKIEIRIQEKEIEDVAVREIVNSIKERLSASVAGRRGEEPPTIYRVPQVLRQVNERCYHPWLFSIGPYHNGSEELKPGEEVKVQHLQALLARNPKLELKDYVRAIRGELEERAARECYSDKIGLESNELVEMMVLDGCFLVEMFIRICQTERPYELWVMHFVSHDMLLLENQIPFCILKRVFHLVSPALEANSIKHLLLYCFRLIPLLPLNDKADQDQTEESNYHHLLDWFHHHCLPPPVKDGFVSSATERSFPTLAELTRIISSVKRQLKNLGLDSAAVPLPEDVSINLPGESQSVNEKMKNPVMSSSGPLMPFSIRSAEELQEAGIAFKKKEKKPGCSFLDIRFHENGVLEIPCFFFSENLQTILQNLIAFEQCYPKAPTFFTGYTSFMDNIINTAKDVQILRHAGILEHGLGSDEELARVFNQMNKGVFWDIRKIHLRKDRQAINEFCGTRWRKYRANLMRNYFYSPWAILSVIGAILLLLLTITQTIFSIYPNV